MAATRKRADRARAARPHRLAAVPRCLASVFALCRLTQLSRTFPQANGIVSRTVETPGFVSETVPLTTQLPAAVIVAAFAAAGSDGLTAGQVAVTYGIDRAAAAAALEDLAAQGACRRAGGVYFFREG